MEFGCDSTSALLAWDLAVVEAATQDRRLVASDSRDWRSLEPLREPPTTFTGDLAGLEVVEEGKLLE